LEGYYALTKDLLLNVQKAQHTGYDSYRENLGRTSNKGLEFSIESKNILKKNFSWTTNFTLAHNTQLVEDIVLVVPKTNPKSQLAAQTSVGDFPTVSLKEFAAEDFLLAGEGTTLRALENQMFAEAGFAPRVVFETPSLQTLNMLSKGGYGLSFIPRFYADDTSNAVYFRTAPSASWELVAAYRKDHYITKAEEYMIGLATDYYRSQA
jgi:DNA-binding transcriptional LysR family regulator